jgi:hypothetical protein
VLRFVESLSLQSGAVIVAVVSGLCAIGWSRLESRSVTWTVSLVTPIVIAAALYWFPVFLGAPSTEYSAWAVIFIAPWSVAGAAAAALVVVVRSRRAAQSLGS